MYLLEGQSQLPPSDEGVLLAVCATTACSTPNNLPASMLKPAYLLPTGPRRLEKECVLKSPSVAAVAYHIARDHGTTAAYNKKSRAKRFVFERETNARGCNETRPRTRGTHIHDRVTPAFVFPPSQVYLCQRQHVRTIRQES